MTNITRNILSLAAAAMLTGLPGLAGTASADTLELTGLLRDFKRGDWQGGHPDFETAHLSGRGGYGLVPGLVEMNLDADHKPLYASTRPSKDTVLSRGSFETWFRDVPGLNQSVPLTMQLDNHAQEEGGVYSIVFSGAQQFFPLDGRAFGNQHLSHNYHFTFELHTTFTYEPGQLFQFVGDDDVWVYVNGVRVIDIGGVHAQVNAHVLLLDGKAFVVKSHFNNASTGGMVHNVTSAMQDDLRVKWAQAGMGGDCPITPSTHRYIDLGLEEGADCELAFFFAERHTTQSNFRIDTSIQLVEVDPTTISPLYD